MAWGTSIDLDSMLYSRNTPKPKQIDKVQLCSIYHNDMYPMTDPTGAAFFWCCMDPINIPPNNVSINIPAPWIRHGSGMICGFHCSISFGQPYGSAEKFKRWRCGWAVSPRSCPLGLQRGGWKSHWGQIGGLQSLRFIWVLGPPCLDSCILKKTPTFRGFCSDSRNAYTSH